MEDVYGKGPALHAVERVQTKMLVDEYRALPVGERLHASYWQLRSSVSGIALEAHRRGTLAMRGR